MVGEVGTREQEPAICRADMIIYNSLAHGLARLQPGSCAQSRQIVLTNMCLCGAAGNMHIGALSHGLRQEGCVLVTGETELK